MKFRRNAPALGVTYAALLLGGCGTSAFRTPAWTLNHSSTTPVTVEQYLQQHVRVYDRMIEDLEAGKHILEVPIIAAAVVGTTGVALGANTDLAIVMGGAGTGLAAGSNYLNARQRLGFVTQARAATVCVNREYVDQVELATALNLLAPGGAPVELTEEQLAQETPQQRRSRELRELPFRQASAEGRLMLLPTARLANGLSLLRPQVAGVGRIAVAATQQIVSRLKSRLANIGAVPNYGQIVADIRASYEDAENRVNLSGANLTDSEEALIRDIAEYSARVDECVAQIQ